MQRDSYTWHLDVAPVRAHRRAIVYPRAERAGFRRILSPAAPARICLPREKFENALTSPRRRNSSERPRGGTWFLFTPHGDPGKLWGYFLEEFRRRSSARGVAKDLSPRVLCLSSPSASRFRSFTVFSRSRWLLADGSTGWNSSRSFHFCLLSPSLQCFGIVGFDESCFWIPKGSIFVRDRGIWSPESFTSRLVPHRLLFLFPICKQKVCPTTFSISCLFNSVCYHLVLLSFLVSALLSQLLHFALIDRSISGRHVQGPQLFITVVHYRDAIFFCRFNWTHRCEVWKSKWYRLLRTDGEEVAVADSSSHSLFAVISSDDSEFM